MFSPRSLLTSGEDGVRIQTIWLQVYILNHFVIIKNWLNLLDLRPRLLIPQTCQRSTIPFEIPNGFLLFYMRGESQKVLDFLQCGHKEMNPNSPAIFA